MSFKAAIPCLQLFTATGQPETGGTGGAGSTPHYANAFENPAAYPSISPSQIRDEVQNADKYLAVATLLSDPPSNHY
jgi:hypothetical protein